MKDTLSKKQILSHMVKTDINYQLHIYDSISSTNELAKKMIYMGDAVAGSIIIANMQTAGRGRIGRSFFSPIGGIYISFIFSGNQILHEEQFFLFAPCVAVCLTLEKLFDINPKIKWPNDIIMDNKKVCGILTETQMSKNGDNIIIGIGVNYSTNLKSFPNDIEAIVGSLKSHVKTLSKNKFVTELINMLNEVRTTSEYKKRMRLLKKTFMQYLVMKKSRQKHLIFIVMVDSR